MCPSYDLNMQIYRTGARDCYGWGYTKWRVKIWRSPILAEIPSFPEVLNQLNKTGQIHPWVKVIH